MAKLSSKSPVAAVREEVIVPFWGRRMAWFRSTIGVADVRVVPSSLIWAYNYDIAHVDITRPPVGHDNNRRKRRNSGR